MWAVVPRCLIHEHSGGALLRVPRFLSHVYLHECCAGATICSRCSDEVYNLYFKHKGGSKDPHSKLFCYDCAMVESRKQDIECTMSQSLDELQKEVDDFLKGIGKMK